MRCRVLTTATFDIFVMGHVIVISRGLLDVLPDEATLATLLAQGLGEIMVSQPTAGRMGFMTLHKCLRSMRWKRLSFRKTDKPRTPSK